MGKTLRKLSNDWYFVNHSRGSVTLHRIADGTKVDDRGELAAEILRSGSEHWISGLWDPADNTPAGRIKRDDWDRWRRITKSIDEGMFDPVTVPITPLRDLCALLRQLDNGKESARTLAVKWTKEPTELAMLLRRSIADFADYENEGEAFREPGGGQRSREESDMFARGVVHRAHGGSLRLEGDRPGLRYVDHEISPRRTSSRGSREARMEGHTETSTEVRTNYSGMGGIDLLLTDGEVPIIGEVKAANDTSLCFALMQSLMYVAELATISQLKRLYSTYKVVLGALNEDHPPSLEIAILYERAEPPDLENAFGLAEALLNSAEHGAEVRKVLRRVAFFEATNWPDGGFVLKRAAEYHGR